MTQAPPDGQVQIEGAQAPVELAIVAGAAGFVTLSNVTVVPSQTGFVLTCDTDQSVQLQVRWFPLSGEALGAVSGGSGTQSDAGAALRHSLSVSMGAGHYGNTFGFEITSLTTPPPTLRPYQGVFHILGARRTAALNAVPVRWNMFGDATRPPGGGGIGNWSSYTWAQYNPKGTTYPTP